MAFCHVLVPIRIRMVVKGTDVPTFADLCLWIAHPSRHWSMLIGVGRRWSSIPTEAKPAHLGRSSPMVANKLGTLAHTNLGRDGQMDGQGSEHWSAYASAYWDPADLCLWGGSDRSGSGEKKKYTASTDYMLVSFHQSQGGFSTEPDICIRGNRRTLDDREAANISNILAHTNLGRDGQMDWQGSAHWSAYASAYRDPADLCLRGGLNAVCCGVDVGISSRACDVATDTH
ncbi:hypothetical protein B0H10DRAFT_1947134 [Mycena sp. CBHHK59/15]|nr:hypothetical protein B0H10DRAFT_1947134 [Mycena sp. CBHHK59/15]